MLSDISTLIYGRLKNTFAFSESAIARLIQILEPASIPIGLRMAGCLPSDVLYDIFSYYQQEEDDFHPLETFLLVSKYWATVALSDHTLWGRYKIRLGHEPTSKMWRTRLPLRLTRSGEIAPLEIDISTEIDDAHDPRRNAKFYSEECLGEGRLGRSFWPCRCDKSHDGLIGWILELLTGPNGQTCERWKTFRFHAERYYSDFGPGSAGRGLFTALSFATPSLVSISLHKLSTNAPTNFDSSLLPFSPLLREVSFSSCCLPTRLPEMNNVRRIQISETSHWRTNFINMEEATCVEQLTMHNQEIGLPLELPHLWHLTLTGWRLTSNIDKVSMRRLSRLSLDLGDVTLWRDMTEGRTLPFEQLKHLEIRRRPTPHGPLDYIQLVTSVFQVLYMSKDLNSILASPPFFSVMLKWTWLGSRLREGLDVENGVQVKPWSWKQGVTLISSSGYLLGEVSGNESSARLEALTRDWGLSSPDVSWETLLQILDFS